MNDDYLDPDIYLWPPECAGCAASGYSYLVDGHPHSFYDFEGVSHAVGDAFECAADHVGLLVACGEAYPCSFCVGVGVWCSLAGEVRKEEEAFAAGCGFFGFAAEHVVGVYAFLLRDCFLGVAEVVSEPLERSAGG